MESRGIHFEVADLKRRLLISKKGHRIAVRNCSKPYVTGENRYFRFKHTFSGAGIDFFLCVCKDFEDDVCFVIPSNKMPERLSISVTPDAIPDQSTYAQFREAWHLLELGR